jgi:hypothetical protein
MAISLHEIANLTFDFRITPYTVMIAWMACSLQHYAMPQMQKKYKRKEI